MNKKQIIASLNKIANKLDTNKLYKEANTITNVMIKIADEFREDYEPEPDTRYAPQRFKDEVAEMTNEYSAYLDEREIRNALIILTHYLETDDKEGYLNMVEDKFLIGRQLDPLNKLKIELMRFARSFYKEMNLEEMDYKYLAQAVRELM